MERWQQIEEIFHQALQHASAEREAYLRDACGGDTALHDEVAGLLAHHDDEIPYEKAWPLIQLGALSTDEAYNPEACYRRGFQQGAYAALKALGNRDSHVAE